jgi:hypothetical protein
MSASLSGDTIQEPPPPAAMGLGEESEQETPSGMIRRRPQTPTPHLLDEDRIPSLP